MKFHLDGQMFACCGLCFTLWMLFQVVTGMKIWWQTLLVSRRPSASLTHSILIHDRKVKLQKLNKLYYVVKCLKMQSCAQNISYIHQRPYQRSASWCQGSNVCGWFNDMLLASKCSNGYEWLIKICRYPSQLDRYHLTSPNIIPHSLSRVIMVSQWNHQ